MSKRIEKIAVVIPLFNKAPHVARAVESVLAQTVPPEEIIVVDDGSSDGGGDIVKTRYGSQVIVIRQHNQGVSAARNRGCAAVNAPYVAFLDADDEWRPNHLEELMDLMAACPDAVLLSTGHLIAREKRLYRPRSAFPDGWRGYVADFFGAYAKGLALVNSSTACVHKASLRAVGGFPVGMRRGEDIVTWCKLALYGAVAHAEVPTVVYQQEAINRTDRLKEADPPGSLRYLAELLDGNQLSPSMRPGVAKLFSRIAIFTAAGFAMNGDRAGVSALRRLAWRQKCVGLATAIALLGTVPPMALRWARRWRHHTV